MQTYCVISYVIIFFILLFIPIFSNMDDDDNVRSVLTAVIFLFSPLSLLFIGFLITLISVGTIINKLNDTINRNNKV